MNKTVRLLSITVLLSVFFSSQLIAGFWDGLKSKSREVQKVAQQKIDKAEQVSEQAIQLTKQKLIAAENAAKRKLIEAENMAVKIKQEAQEQYEIAAKKTKAFIRRHGLLKP